MKKICCALTFLLVTANLFAHADGAQSFDDAVNWAFKAAESHISYPQPGYRLLDEQKMKQALIGNTVLREEHFALYFKAQGEVAGWERNWQEVAASHCPTDEGVDYARDLGTCWVGPLEVLEGLTWRIDKNRLCLSRPVQQVTGADSCVTVALTADRIVFISATGEPIERGNLLAKGDRASCLGMAACNSMPLNQQEKINRLASEMQARFVVPGLALAIVRQDQLWYANGYGLADIENNTMVKPDTVFQLGSVGKQFTAAAIMRLVELGKLELDTSIKKFFPESPASHHGITVRQLLSHISGIRDYEYTGYETVPGKTPGTVVDIQRNYTEQELQRIIFSYPLRHAPGLRREYSNSGYVLLGFIIEAVSGEHYSQFLQREFFSPLGMTDTRLISDALIVPRRAQGYELSDKRVLVNQSWVAEAHNRTADGALISTVLDMAKWETALATGKILTEQSRKSLWQSVPLSSNNLPEFDYALGWALARVQGRKIVEHGGSWQGFRSYYARFVDDGFSVIVLTNGRGAQPLQDLTRQIAAILDVDLALPEIVNDTSSSHDQQVRALVLQLTQKKLTDSQFTTAERQRWFPYAVIEQGNWLADLLDEKPLQLQQVSPVPVVTDVLHYRITTASDPAHFAIRFDKAGKIAHWRFEQMN
jgi:CubicO group peptidase (beta-lactamase class C family)